MLTWWEGALRVLGAMVMGAIIGWEREAQGKPAGFRTHIIVALGAALFVVSGEMAAEAAGEPIDAVRAMAAIAQGVGFLGAGIIYQTRGEVRWLTTAASIWAAAAVGLALGLGMYGLGAVGSLAVVFTLHWLDLFERRLFAREKKKKKNAKKAETDEAPPQEEPAPPNAPEE
ncbi:MAG: MgtC/SapB family protein [Chloroflexi bacterium]|nr:MgtC/SapB family protein [Chloroflexota bacterium]